MSNQTSSLVQAHENDFGNETITKVESEKASLPTKYRGLKNKSEVMVKMFEDGLEVKEIYKIMKKVGLVNHYQHVRNTLINKGLITSSKARS